MPAGEWNADGWTMGQDSKGDQVGVQNKLDSELKEGGMRTGCREAGRWV